MSLFYNFFDCLGRAFSAGIREFQKAEEEIDRCPDVRSFKIGTWNPQFGDWR